MPAALSPELAGEVGRVLARLHEDRELASSLSQEGDPVQTCARAYLHSYHDRFLEDLAFIEADPPPFVGRDLLEKLREEADALAAHVLRSAAFEALADRPAHRDVWRDNILVDHAGGWFLLDWDGLALADPVMDWAMFLGPSPEDLQPASEEAVLAHGALGAAERRRLSTYARASLLDWIIDPLADWVQGGREAARRESGTGRPRSLLPPQRVPASSSSTSACA